VRIRTTSNSHFASHGNFLATDEIRAALFAHVAKFSPESDIPFLEGYEGLYHERRLECALQRYDSVAVERGSEASSRQALHNLPPSLRRIAIIHTSQAIGHLREALSQTSFSIARSLGIAATEGEEGFRPPQPSTTDMLSRTAWWSDGGGWELIQEIVDENSKAGI